MTLHHKHGLPCSAINITFKVSPLVAVLSEQPSTIEEKSLSSKHRNHSEIYNYQDLTIHV